LIVLCSKLVGMLYNSATQTVATVIHSSVVISDKLVFLLFWQYTSVCVGTVW